MVSGPSLSMCFVVENLLTVFWSFDKGDSYSFFWQDLQCESRPLEVHRLPFLLMSLLRVSFFNANFVWA